MSVMPVSDAICRACRTVREQTGHRPTAIRTVEATLTAWIAEMQLVAIEQSGPKPLAALPPPTAHIGQFDGIPIYLDARVPPGQIDVVDYQGGRVLVRV
jgi:hypothetical protein